MFLIILKRAIGVGVMILTNNNTSNPSRTALARTIITPENLSLAAVQRGKASGIVPLDAEIDGARSNIQK